MEWKNKIYLFNVFDGLVLGEFKYMGFYEIIVLFFKKIYRNKYKKGRECVL